MMDTDAADDAKIIDCPQCRIKNPIESDICYNCGAPLHETPTKKKRRPWIPVGVLFLLIAGAFYFYDRSHKTEPTPSPLDVSSTDTASSTRKEAEPPRKTVPATVPATVEEDLIIIPVGLLRIRDISGNLIAEISVPVVSDGWIALPTRRCLGGYTWTLQMGSGSQQVIEGGIINDLDQISLWRIREDQRIESPELYPWSAVKPLTWLELNSPDPPEPIEISGITREGNFDKGTITGDPNAPGVFIQDQRVVGWTFGDLIDGAFLWTGEAGRNLSTEIRVDDYYRLTFAGSREEEFIRALALGEDYSNLDRLEALVAAFRFEPRLSEDRTPDYLKPEAVISQIRSLIARSVEDGFGLQAASYFDAEVLAQTQNIPLMSDVIILIAEGYGLEEAVDLTENAIEGFEPKNSQEKTELKKLHAGLYQNWLNVLLESGDIQEGWQVYERSGRQLSDDLNIYLFGVKLALAENDWETAERLLSSREYPPALTDQVRSLQSQISELKGLQGKIVIRFTPGTRQIPVTASLNQQTQQDFIVDTGASMVTIPFSTARDLGIIISVRNPRRRVYTASGELYAPEVVLDSITLEGFQARNVKALVMDIPNQPDVGLLGLNYLRRFRMDLNTDEGTLLLAPK